VIEQFGYELRAVGAQRLGECDPSRVGDLVREHGWVHFAGFRASRREFEDFTDAAGECDPTVEVEYRPGGKTLEFHAEDSYNPYRPDLIWLLCVNKGGLGGAPTIVTDGVRSFAEMSEDWQRFCRDHRLRFGRLWSARAWEGSVGVDRRAQLEATLRGLPGVTFEFLPDGALYVSYETPILARTTAGEESFSNSVLHAVNFPEWYGMSLADGAPVPDGLGAHARDIVVRHQASLEWGEGDLLAIDNVQTMHRRPDYEGLHRVLLKRHCRSFFGTPQPDTRSPMGAWVKGLLNQELGEDPVYYPIRTGPLDRSWYEERR
jgi:hypothetical protein